MPNELTINFKTVADDIEPGDLYVNTCSVSPCLFVCDHVKDGSVYPKHGGYPYDLCDVSKIEPVI